MTGWRRGIWVGLCFAAALTGPSTAFAQAPCLTTSAPSRTVWPAPLNRIITVQPLQSSLRETLDRVAQAGEVRLSYSAETIPLDRSTCEGFSSVPVGDALTRLLGGGIRLVTAGADQIVLAAATAAPPPFPPPAPTQVVPLDRIVVTGNPAGAPLRSLAFALEVLDREEIEASGGNISRLLSSSVPGIWAWSQAPNNLLSRYGSIRGASSFGASYPKIYIDGIEVANPLVISQISADAVERVEVIRGPQGAALYGSDAISGVINIVTRHSSGEQATSDFRIRSNLSLAQSDFRPGASLAQEHALSVLTGSATQSANAHLQVGTAGEFIPGAYNRHLAATANARSIGDFGSISGLARISVTRARAVESPLLSAQRAILQEGAPVLALDPQASDQATLGATATLTPAGNWTHVLLAGLDASRLRAVPETQLPIPTFDLTSLVAGEGTSYRGTLRGTSMRQLDLGSRTSGMVTFGLEQGLLRYLPSLRAVDGGNDGSEATVGPEWQRTSSALAQGQISFMQSAFLTGGFRLERSEGLADYGSDVLLLPMLGATLVRERGEMTVKLRAAYGKGTRPPRSLPRESSWARSHSGMRNDLKPEQQEGVEVGLDLFMGTDYSLQITRFDQLASGLIQRVGTPTSDTSSGTEPNSVPRRRIPYYLQNVGEISNRGWEVQGSATRGPLVVNGALSLVDSRVEKVALGYGGDLQVGDRPLEVPEATLSLSGSWTGPRWSASVTSYRAFDWMNYDRIALAAAFVEPDRSDYDLVGQSLRSYWKEYDGVTHLDATLRFSLPTRATLVLSCTNLLDTQVGEPDNITVVPGRALSVGFETSF